MVLAPESMWTAQLWDPLIQHILPNYLQWQDTLDPSHSSPGRKHQGKVVLPVLCCDLILTLSLPQIHTSPGLSFIESSSEYFYQMRKHKLRSAFLKNYFVQDNLIYLISNLKCRKGFFIIFILS